MTFSRIKNLTSKNLPKISEAFTVVINLTPSDAWFEGVVLRLCSKCSWMSEDTTNLTKTLAGRFLECILIKKL